MRDNQLKAAILIIIFLVLLLQTVVTQAQSSESRYTGLFASLGTRSVMVASNIEQINGTDLMEAGGQIGIVFGNEILRSTAGLFGYYSSAGNTPGTTALYTTNASLNFYPLQLLSRNNFVFEPYLTGGLAYDRFKFFGYYVNQEPGVTNYSQAEAPFLGKIKQINATVGLGVEVRLRDDFDFIHLFSEVKYGHSLSTKTAHDPFAETTLENRLQTVVGISFGASR